MIDLIRELVQLLSQDQLSIDAVIARVGPVERDPGGLMPIELRPVLAGVETANLARDPDNGVPYVLTLEPSADTQLTTTVLHDAFGEYRRLRTDRGQPPEIIFYPPVSGTVWKVAVIARLQSALESFDDQHVSSLSLRRDRLS